MLCDSVALAVGREDDYVNSIICIAKAMAPRAGAIIPALSGVFLQADVDTSWEAAEALALIFYSNGNSDALRVLVSSASGDCRPELRRTAVNALGLLGNKGVAVQRLLRTLLKDEDAEVCKAAILGLAKQRGAALPAVRELTEMLKQDSELTDYLQYAVEEITGKPSPVSRPRTVGSLLHRPRSI